MPQDQESSKNIKNEGKGEGEPDVVAAGLLLHACL